MRLSLIWLLFFGFSLPLMSQIHELTYDSSKLDVRSFDQNKLESLKNEKAFQYDFNDVAVETWYQRLWRKILEWLSRISELGLIIQIVFYVVLLFVLVLLILSLMGVSVKSLFYKKPASFTIPVHENEMNIHEISFDQLINNAVNNENFKLAVRYGYLKMLKLLNDVHLIHWERNKTNRQYIRELQPNDLKNWFAQICRDYEYAWYGNFNIGKSNYVRFRKTFDKLLHALNEKRVA